MRAGAAVVALGMIGSTAWADRVIDIDSAWDHAHARIYSEVLVAKDDGSIESTRVPGGVVDGIGMVRFDSLVGPQATTPNLLGFVPSRTKSGTRIKWRAGCVMITPDERGTTDLESDSELQVIDHCLEEWVSTTRTCGYLIFQRGAPQRLEVGFDGVNMIKFREEEWCSPATACDPKDCYNTAAAAVTTVFFIDRPGADNDGEILDADVEINAVDYAVYSNDQTLGNADRGADLANTLTHELGHLVGLDHTCWDQDGPAPTDGAGNPVPDCLDADLPPEVTEATMFAYQEPQTPPETKKATLEPDDIDGFCASYPKAQDPGYCELAIVNPGFVGNVGCGQCSVAGRPGAGAGLGLLGLALLLLVLPFRAKCAKPSSSSSSRAARNPSRR